MKKAGEKVPLRGNSTGQGWEVSKDMIIKARQELLNHLN